MSQHGIAAVNRGIVLDTGVPVCSGMLYFAVTLVFCLTAVSHPKSLSKITVKMCLPEREKGGWEDEKRGYCSLKRLDSMVQLIIFHGMSQDYPRKPF